MASSLCGKKSFGDGSLGALDQSSLSISLFWISAKNISKVYPRLSRRHFCCKINQSLREGLHGPDKMVVV